MEKKKRIKRVFIFFIISVLGWLIVFQDNVKSSENYPINRKVEQIEELVLSPDGKKLAVALWDKFHKANLGIILIETGAVKKLTSHSECISCLSWSPDSTHIYYRKSFDIYSYNLSQNDEVFLWKRKDNEFTGKVSVSPKGNLIGFTLRRFSEKSAEVLPKDVWIKDIKSKKMEQITTGGIAYWGGWCWSNDGEKFFYSKEGFDGIYEINVKTKKEKMVIDNFIISSSDIVFSPDGKQLFLYDTKSENFYIISFLPAPTVIFTGDNNYVVSAAWAPSGDKLGFYKLEKGKWNLWIIENGGETQKRTGEFSVPKGFLTRLCWLSDTEIIFSPDGKTIWDKNLITGESRKISDPSQWK